MPASRAHLNHVIRLQGEKFREFQLGVLHSFWKWTRIELFSFIMIISSTTWNEAALLELNPIMQCRGTILILSKFLLLLAGCCNMLLNRNFAAEIVGRMQESQLFLQFATPQTTSKYIMRCSWVVMYTVLSPRRYPRPQSTISVRKVLLFHCCASDWFETF